MHGLGFSQYVHRFHLCMGLFLYSTQVCETSPIYGSGCVHDSPLYGSVLVQYVQREAQEVVGPPNRPGR